MPECIIEGCGLPTTTMIYRFKWSSTTTYLNAWVCDQCYERGE